MGGTEDVLMAEGHLTGARSADSRRVDIERAGSGDAWRCMPQPHPYGDSRAGSDRARAQGGVRRPDTGTKAHGAQSEPSGVPGGAPPRYADETLKSATPSDLPGSRRRRLSEPTRARRWKRRNWPKGADGALRQSATLLETAKPLRRRIPPSPLPRRIRSSGEVARWADAQNRTGSRKLHPCIFHIKRGAT